MHKQQSIGCEVSSCEYHAQGECELSRIIVRPCTGYSSGDPMDETLCGSYKQK